MDRLWSDHGQEVYRRRNIGCEVFGRRNALNDEPSVENLALCSSSCYS